ncbi:RNA polymerase, sigma-24 subunit, ECF subfamily [Pseudopedobacter saltans DSM 12145]|uniref:RNA polymerase, sigma-24 subunit, ECF subfamily n=1 Tax=Pseudopedobacter saltans (strain ATCC 51119 / DSM 12145 / JCM 21818 / CCUG 39354 / LMG 10337 / NBRC 100064 / NCIMB 13643) TaxID=762903 RepID=F0SDC6_PSESL|nr:RNA polymerase sigma factor [Pseudopedobacter saltans]ADY52912.1 RNA polymerase, sigma-24 subunit, ECF subfamily [Pseudopedobacter saltans DSM 12145]
MNLQNKYSLSEIIEGCQKTDRRFQELLYKMMASKMLGVCMRYAKTKFEAEDILQTGFIKVFKHIQSYKAEGSFEGWIRRIMVNTSIEFYRKSMRTLNVLDIEETGVEISSSEIELSSIQAKDLMTLIQSLSEVYRMVFNMYAIEGYSHKEIANTLGITEGASKVQLSRARTVLKEKIKKLERQGYEVNVG